MADYVPPTMAQPHPAPPTSGPLGHSRTRPHNPAGWDSRDDGPAAARAATHEQLLAAIAFAVLDTGRTSYATRGVRVRDLLHAAGYHGTQLDAAGRLLTGRADECDHCAYSGRSPRDRGGGEWGWALRFCACAVLVLAVLSALAGGW